MTKFQKFGEVSEGWLYPRLLDSTQNGSKECWFTFSKKKKEKKRKKNVCKFKTYEIVSGSLLLVLSILADANSSKSSE